LPNVATMYIICRLASQCPFAYSSVLLHLRHPIPFFGYVGLPFCVRVPAPQHGSQLQFRSQISAL